MTNLRELIRLHRKRSVIAGIVIVILLVFYHQFYFTIGMRYDDTFFHMKNVNGTTVYTGLTSRGRMDISVSDPNDGVTVVSYQLGDFSKKTYFVSMDPATSDNSVRKVSVIENGGRIFTGALDGKYLTDENGEVVFDDQINTVTNMNKVQHIDSGEEMTSINIIRMAQHQYDTLRGKPQFLTPALFILLMTILDMTFPMLFFSLHHGFWVKNPEPNETYLAGQKASWIIFPFISLVLFVLAVS